MAKAIAEGVYFGGYRYDEYVSDNENGRLEFLNVTLIDDDAKTRTQLVKGALMGTELRKGNFAGMNSSGNFAMMPVLENFDSMRTVEWGALTRV